MTAFNEVYSMVGFTNVSTPRNRWFHECFNDTPPPFPVCTMKQK